MVTAHTVLKTIDLLALERGEKRESIYHLITTTGELITFFGLKPSIPHHEHIKGVVKMQYPGTTTEMVKQGDNSKGFKLHIKIRSK